MHELSVDELNGLKSYYYSNETQRNLQIRYTGGLLSRDSNSLTAPVSLASDDAVVALPPSRSKRGIEYIAIGEDAVRQTKVGLLILNGGMATRFGGVVKGTVSVLGDLSFLGLKLLTAKRLSNRLGGTIPIYIMNSFATDDITRDHLSRHDYFGYPRDSVTLFLQNTLLRLNPDGTFFRHNNGSLSPYGPGHGDVAEAVARDALSDIRNRNLSFLHMSNVDNLLATPYPLIFGYHLSNEMEMTVETVRNRGKDVGGAPAIVNGKVQIVEAFRFPADFPTGKLTHFNTNTFCFSRSVFERSYNLDWFVVEKRVEDRPAVQFERLAGQLSAFVPCSFIEVERDGEESRFSPIKDRPTLEKERARIMEVLAARGLIQTPEMSSC